MSTTVKVENKNARGRGRPKKRVPKKTPRSSGRPAPPPRPRRQRRRGVTGPTTANYRNNLFAAPVSYGRTTQSSRASDRTQVVPGREYLGDVTGSGTSITSTTYYWNPGDAAIFPWLSGIAAKFMNWRFRKLKVIYQGTSSTTEKGDVILATVPNFDAALLTTKQHFLDEANMTRAIPWCPSIVHDVLASRASHFLNWYCVSNPDGTPASGTDYDKYEFGFTQLGCFGNSGSTVVGELWVEYECEFEGRRVNSIGLTPFVTSTDLYTMYLIGTGTFTSLAPIGSITNAHGTRWYDNPGGMLEWFLVYSSGFASFQCHNPHPYEPNADPHYFLAYAAWEYTGTAVNAPVWTADLRAIQVTNPFQRKGIETSPKKSSCSMLFYIPPGALGDSVVSLQYAITTESVTNCRVCILDVGLTLTGIAKKQQEIHHQLDEKGGILPTQRAPQLATAPPSPMRPSLDWEQVVKHVVDDDEKITPGASEGFLSRFF